MNFQSATSANLAEAVFRSVIHGITGTVTSTSTNYASLYLGEPVVLSTATIGVGALGQEVIRPLTATNVVINRLCVGPVASATIAKEGMGLVQVYGIATVRLAEAATVAAGDKLIPDINTTATALATYGRTCWIARTITDADLHYSQRAHVIAVAPATAVSGTLSYTNGTAFVRAL
jgi:hypothetical protein